MQIYYQSIPKKQEDYLTIADYIWRWDTDWFWCSKQFYMQHFIPRLLFGKWLLKSTAYWKLKHFFNTNSLAKKLANKMLGQVESVVQDVQIPIQSATEFYDFFQRGIGIKPIWICPTQSYRSITYPFYKMNANMLYVNFGFWDMLETKQADGFYNKKIENKVRELSGNKSLYSRIYYSENEFWQIFDRPLYQHLKSIYDPQSKLGDLYQKSIGK